MNKYKLAAIAGVAALALVASNASATTNVLMVTGSTAFRAHTGTAIAGLLQAGYKYGWAGTGSDPTGANQIEFIGQLQNAAGTLPAGSWVDFKCAYTGSIAGIIAVASSQSTNLWLNGGASLAAGTYLYQGGTNASTGGQNGISAVVSGVPDCDLADTPQSETQAILATTTLTGTAVNPVGIVPFTWAKNADSPSTLNNMTANVAQELLSNGSVPLSFFTGIGSDASTNVYVVGRNTDSGTRLITFAETGFGMTSVPVQTEVNNTSGSGATVTLLQYYPAETINGIPYAVGASGYSSGGKVASALSIPGSSGAVNNPDGSQGCYLVGYLSTADANSLKNGAGSITYNGTWSTTNAVAQGQCTFWGMEHFYYRSATQSTAQGHLADAIATAISTTYAATPTSLTLGAMQVGRSADGGPVSQGASTY